MSNLYIVATPIGNLEDITLRALNTLRSVDYIACEDTRKTSKILHHYNIEKKRLLACHTHNERSSAQGIIQLMQAGNDIAYCSDAGTPSISDPGSRLVESVLQADLNVIPIPGVSAFATLVSVAGLRDESLFFAGFLPHRGQKRSKRLQEILQIPSAILLYESPYRVESLINELACLIPDRYVVIGREMTKFHEEFLRDSAKNLAENLSNLQQQGEFALIISHNHKC
ncbi:16S rRNA (cytidine(1402)-2'-O)-methyltransferase [Entomospira nematocerorum]|uniref:Ribosomal RNA small subunit methyltransferase I n=1 Tax=Entomospira nematocerorum TaxID=2719987 RepID=A0A968KT54_9SPIO|nr:16S rRNA (cytidine(1402)-2'-O)-methyltransferase [Entomospira nematocera]NIZ47071.1 16S rRNA (cytidine(1402)-2'-O)-methyltransferase [Entomospira nematocera]WDI34384.1 16S rRNA (cytidine(1402)-2'-O)-methyltransferase [Entomospira nematocera]